LRPPIPQVGHYRLVSTGRMPNSTRFFWRHAGIAGGLHQMETTPTGVESEKKAIQTGSCRRMIYVPVFFRRCRDLALGSTPRLRPPAGYRPPHPPGSFPRHPRTAGPGWRWPLQVALNGPEIRPVMLQRSGLTIHVPSIYTLVFADIRRRKHRKPRCVRALKKAWLEYAVDSTDRPSNRQQLRLL